MQVVEPAERARQIVVDELQRAAQALEADLHEDARRILDVVARGLHQPRDLSQLRDDPPGALGERRVGEQRLSGQARREDVGVVLRAALPGADRFELEQPRADVGVERRPLEAFGVGQARRIDGGETPREGAELPDLGVNRRTAQILEQVIVQMDAVEGRVGRMHLVQIREVFIDEVRQGFG